MSVTNAVNTPASASPMHSTSSPANQRSSQDFARAMRHSKRVTLLQKLLPVLAVTIVLGFVTSIVMSFTPDLPDLSAKIGLEDGKLVMSEPKMAGFDKNKRAYDVNAFKAIQDLAKPGTVELEKIDARLPMGATAFANIEANSGTYDSRSERLNLRDNITITGASGMNIQLKEADINMKTGTMVSNKPVFVQSKDADISANSIEVKDNGKRIVFKERVKMIIHRQLSSPSPNTSPREEIE